MLERFWSKVDKKGPYPHKKACKIHPEIKNTRCWIWTAACDTNDYGVFSICKGIKVFAHRYAYEQTNGKDGLSNKLCCLHKCDNTKCVRPLHLFKGTKKQNTLDMLSKGRESHSQIGNAKLSKADVIRLRKLHSSGKYLYRDLGSMFGIGKKYVGVIVNRQCWKFI